MANSLNFVSLSEIPESLLALWESANPDFFNRISWYQLLAEHVLAVEGKECGFLTVIKQSKIIALSPVCRSKHSKSQHWESLANYYSPIISPPIIYDAPEVLTENRDNLTLLELRDYSMEGLPAKPNGLFEIKERNIFITALQAHPKQWDRLTIRPLDSAQADNWQLYFKKYRYTVIPFYCFANWYLPIDGQSFADYFSSLPSKVRNTVVRKTKQFKQIPGATITIIQESRDLEKYINDYESVYQGSWKTSETYPLFIAALMRYAAERGELRLGLAYLGETPVAAQLWIVADQTAYIYKLAYQEQYKQYGAGSVLTARLIEHVIDVDQVKTIDYLTGDDAYKQEWMSQRRERWGVMVFNHYSLYGILAAIKYLPKYLLKRVVSR